MNLPFMSKKGENETNVPLADLYAFDYGTNTCFLWL